MTLKRAEVKLLPTKQKGNTLIFRENRLMWQDKRSAKNDRKHPITKYFHLYILSDEEIKEGEILPYMMCWSDGSCELINSNNRISEARRLSGLAKKIIATTDKLVHPKDFKDVKDWYLPQPSEDFIRVYAEAYNKNDIIKYVDVEYQEIEIYQEIKNEGFGSYFGKKESEYKLKVNSKNEISIRKIKDIWTRDEVEELLLKCNKDLRLLAGDRLHKWIEDNL